MSACEHGHQPRKCPHCDLATVEAERDALAEQVARLEAERDGLAEMLVDEGHTLAWALSHPRVECAGDDAVAKHRKETK